MLRHLKACTRPITNLLYKILIRGWLKARWYNIHRTLDPFPEHTQFVTNAMRLQAFAELDGDYLEFGVASGANFCRHYHRAQAMGLTSMRFYAFDSFQGLPEITGDDARGFCQYMKGQFAHDLPAFKRALAQYDVDLDKVDIVPGWFDDVLNDETKKKLQLKRATMVWIDCDLYESTVPVLDFVTDYLQTGTLLVFDDWFCFRGDPTRGEQRAFTEWLERNPLIGVTQYRKYGSSGNSFLVHRH